MKKSLGRKVCGIGLMLICIFVLMNIALAYFLLIPFSAYLSKSQMRKIAVSIENLDSYTDEDFEEYLNQLDEDMGTQITIIDEEKNIICTTSGSYAFAKKLGEHSTRLFDHNLDKLKRGEYVSDTRLPKDSDTNKVRITLIKKVAENRFVVLYRSYRSLQNAMKVTIIFDVLSGIVVICIGFIFIYQMSRYLVVPIQKMMVTAEHISNMEFDSKIEICSEDELGQLGVSINKMSDHLERNLESLQNDIEKRKRLIRNLSHEIKSPMAVIMGYSDRLKTIISKNPDKASQYCEIISNESSRVDRLVREMMEFSKLEQDSGSLNRERFAVKLLFEELKKRFLEETMEHPITYQEEYEEQDEIYADYNLLERAMYNLIKNAIIYGTPQNLVIQVSGGWKGDYYEFRVFNTGNPIRETESDALWEAFNKEDKVRTRGNQGYGIGLAIVREIVEAHQGYYSVQNVENGVEFCISIRK